MKPITKPTVMARIGHYRHSFSDYGHIEVSFSIVNEANYYDVPKFSGSCDFDRPMALGYVDNIKVTSQLSADFNNGKALVEWPYAYELALNMREPRFNHELVGSVKQLQKLDRAIAKLVEKEGSYRNFAEYLKMVFRALKVGYITYESHAEKSMNRKWHGYKLNDIDALVAHGVRYLADDLGWTLPQQEQAA